MLVALRLTDPEPKLVEATLPLLEIRVALRAVGGLLSVGDGPVAILLRLVLVVKELRNQASSSGAASGEAVWTLVPLVLKVKLEVRLQILEWADEVISSLILLIPLNTGTDAALAVVLLMTSVNGTVASVVPLYIIVTDGHMLSAGIGPPYLGKQYCSNVDAADAVVKELFVIALLPLKRELTANGRRRLVIAKCYWVVAGFRQDSGWLKYLWPIGMLTLPLESVSSGLRVQCPTCLDHLLTVSQDVDHGARAGLSNDHGEVMH
jgi:hypothetical protein